MGSVKNLTLIKEATEDSMGVGVFEFTDDYSVFDYGKMPDTIEFKGESLCRMSAYNFKELEKKLEIKTHFRKFIAPNKMEVDIVRILMPQNKQIFEETRNYLVPLEVIFRNSLPKGSSVFKRIEAGELSLDDLGVEEMPKPGHKFENAFIDVSTKLEETDRYLSWDEAMEISQVSEDQLYDLKEIALNINDYITEKAASIGLEHADGKVEFAITPKNEIMLVDVCGTLDENRFLWNGIHVSKQVARDYYKTTPWYEELEAAKKNNVEKADWPAPPLLPEDLRKIISDMYTSVCNAWTGEKKFKSPSIAEVMNSYKAFLENPSAASSSAVQSAPAPAVESPAVENPADESPAEESDSEMNSEPEAQEESSSEPETSTGAETPSETEIQEESEPAQEQESEEPDSDESESSTESTEEESSTESAENDSSEDAMQDSETNSEEDSEDKDKEQQ